MALAFLSLQKMPLGEEMLRILCVGPKEISEGLMKLGLGKDESVKEFTQEEKALNELLKGDFDLAFLEVSALSSPLKTILHIRSKFPQKPVVFLSHSPDIKQAVDLIKAGAMDYLQLPVERGYLMEILRKVKSNGRCHLEIHKGQEEFNIITEDPRMMEIIEMAAQVAVTDTTILIEGETGTGKELLARFIHQKSQRATGPYVAVNCASLPETLAESELFGHEKGAFTGALSRKIGKFELANKGTIVLDEISEMPLTIQAKLLRTIQERQIDRVGGTKPVPIDARIIAISNKPLEEEVREKRFREDLYFRINVFPLRLPPLRERKNDIKLLANYFLNKFSIKYNKQITGISDDAFSLLLNYEWKGNIRELSNTIERAVLMCKKTKLDTDTIQINKQEKKELSLKIEDMTIDEMEKLMIQNALKRLNGNRTHAAKVLGISLRTLRNKLRLYREQGLVL